MDSGDNLEQNSQVSEEKIKEIEASDKKRWDEYNKVKEEKLKVPLEVGEKSFNYKKFENTIDSNIIAPDARSFDLPNCTEMSGAELPKAGSFIAPNLESVNGIIKLSRKNFKPFFKDNIFTRFSTKVTGEGPECNWKKAKQWGSIDIPEHLRDKIKWTD